LGHKCHSSASGGRIDHYAHALHQPKLLTLYEYTSPYLPDRVEPDIGAELGEMTFTAQVDTVMRI
jgi:hypothetical protein